ncbi:hypothetical protein E2562_033812 [Oryza meyeriana var. granulata]|uniref:protein-disulfide reductase n=1 Tax=Oryza meyeriana var. granulata TaxID=110450 RepID=A0A6G1F1A2_9ORYZ|nr:hypothetical protein E2562_033812 [Oryza meyeriana var. granulata]
MASSSSHPPENPLEWITEAHDRPRGRSEAGQGVDTYPFGAKRRGELEGMDDARRQGGNLQELLGCNERDYVISADGIKIPISDLNGKTIGLYFGAHWCPPCRAFTKQLREAYNELKTLRPGNFQM